MGLFNLPELTDHKVKRLFPTNPNPIPSQPFHGIAYSLGMIHYIECGITLGAESTFGNGMFLHVLYILGNAVLNNNIQTAATTTIGTDGRY